MKIFIPKINESWIVDRFRNEWISKNQNSHTSFLYNSEIIWILSPWMWHKISKKSRNNKNMINGSLITHKHAATVRTHAGIYPCNNKNNIYNVLQATIDETKKYTFIQLINPCILIRMINKQVRSLNTITKNITNKSEGFSDK